MPYRANLGLAVTAKRQSKPKIDHPRYSGFLEFPKLPEGQNAASFWHSNAENFSAWGAEFLVRGCPWTTGFGSAPDRTLGLRPQTSIIDSRCSRSALAMCPPHRGPCGFQPPENNFSLRPCWYLQHACHRQQQRGLKLRGLCWRYTPYLNKKHATLFLTITRVSWSIFIIM